MMKKLLMIVVAVMIAVMIGGTAHAELIVAYGFNGSLADVSGNGYDGIGNGPIAYDADVPEGLSGSSLVLDGESTVEAPINAVNPFDGSGDFSIAIWFKTDQAGLILSSARDNTSDNHSFAVFVQGGGAVAADNFWVGAVISSGGFNDGQWHHLVVLYTPAEYELVIDGESNGSAGHNPEIPNIVADTVLIGNSLNTEFPIGDGETEPFVGNLKDLAIFNHILSDEEIADLMANGLSPTSASEPDPSNGGFVSTTNPLRLSWTNLAPTDPGDSVYVDVWWGTEPNALDNNKIVVAGESVDFVDVDSSAVDTYYWRVDSYLNGLDDINEPNRVEGTLWSYTAVADMWPTVQIVTLDQMTWAGEGVPLSATVTDDGESAVTIEWSADLPTGISAAFNPGDDVDTTVTLTKTPYSEASIVNPGFEEPVLADGDDALTPEVSGWEEGYYGAGGTGWSGWSDLCRAINPDVTYGYGGDAYAGENILYCRVDPGYDSGVTQTLAEVLQAETTYELSVMVGTPGGIATPAPYHIELLADDLKVAEEIGDAPASDTWILVTLTHTTGSAETDPTVGEPITIRLIAADGPGGVDVNFDEVVLTADPPFGPGVQTVTVTVAVSDEANPAPNTASIEIDVYDDACHMARVGQGRSAATDFNANCITGLEELVVMVGAWLDDYSSTGPAAK